MNDKLPSMFACFYLTMILLGKTWVKNWTENFAQRQWENETSTDFWDFGSTRITVPSKVPFIWIAHACLWWEKSNEKTWAQNKTKLFTEIFLQKYKK
jgi:hypothetical protein